MRIIKRHLYSLSFLLCLALLSFTSGSKLTAATPADTDALIRSKQEGNANTNAGSQEDQNIARGEHGGGGGGHFGGGGGGHFEGGGGRGDWGGHHGDWGGHGDWNHGDWGHHGNWNNWNGGGFYGGVIIAPGYGGYYDNSGYPYDNSYYNNGYYNNGYYYAPY